MKYLKNISISFIWIISSIIILSFLTTLFNYFNIISDKILPIINIIIPIISLFIGGIKIGNKSKTKGYIEGLKLGIIFSIFLIIFNYLALDVSFKFKYILFYIILITCSIFGSIIGINKTKKED